MARLCGVLTDANKSSYKILLKRSGIAPNYVINGLVMTTAIWNEGGKVRYDLLGKAMQSAGIDSGMTRSPTVVSGYGGQWNEKSSDYSNITTEGLLAYRVGYDSSMYSVYLRRDGTLPMTGDLNMGGKNINNAKDITAAGTVMAEILKSTGSTNVGGALTVVGNSTLAGPVEVRSTLSVSGASTYGGIVQVNNVINATGNINTTADINSKRVYSGYIQSTGRITSDEYVQINGIAVSGAACSPNGLIGRSSAGDMLSCQSGVWGSGGKVEVIYGSNPVCSANKIPVARYWTQPGGSNYGNYCTLQTGWAGVTTPSCESCVNWEKCHMVYSASWSATACS